MPPGIRSVLDAAGADAGRLRWRGPAGAPPNPRWAAQLADARRADILAWLPPLRQTGQTSGGEWHGPCPRCGGEDRFMAWPQHPRGPRACCRQCHPTALDPIALVQWLGLARGFTEAVALLAGRANPPAPLRSEGKAETLPSPARGGAGGEVEPPKPYRPPRGRVRVVARYNYYRVGPQEGDPPILMYQKERWQPGFRGRAKTFVCRHPRPGVAAPRDDQPEDWLWGMGTAHRAPYNWPAALDAPPHTPLYWVDGEKDVESARALGLIAVCGPDGGGSWCPEWSALFYDHPAYLIADGTPEGLAQAELTACLLDIFPDSITIQRLPAKDLTAWMGAGCPPVEGISYDR